MDFQCAACRIKYVNEISAHFIGLFVLFKYTVGVRVAVATLLAYCHLVSFVIHANDRMNGNLMRCKMNERSGYLFLFFLLTIDWQVRLCALEYSVCIPTRIQ